MADETQDTGQPWWPDAAPVVASPGPKDAPLLRMYAPGNAPRAGAIALHEVRADYAWHFHDMHKLLYAFEGAIEIEVENGAHLIPRQLAAWVPAGVAHRLGNQKVSSAAVFLPADAVANPGSRIRTIMAPPLMREMMREALRWYLPNAENDLRKAFFGALGALCAEWIGHEADLFMPSAGDPRLQRVLQHTSEHPEARLGEVCAMAGMSERTFRRHVQQDLGLSWEALRMRIRLLKAVSLLGDAGLPVTRVALDCGFDSPSAFSRAFRGVLGESPSDYRRRVRNP